MTMLELPRPPQKGEIITETFMLKDGSVKLELAFRVENVQGMRVEAQIIGAKRTDLTTGEVVERGEDDEWSGD